MKNIFFVFIGGGLGSIVRYMVSLLCVANLENYRQLIALAIVNIIGGIGAGVVASKFDSESARLLLLTGVMGGFTTFSAFSLEVFKLIEKQQWGLSLVFVSLVLVGSIFGVLLGHKI